VQIDPGLTNNFYRRWDRILFECSTRLLKLLLDDASYQKKGFEKIVSDLLNTSEEQLIGVLGLIPSLLNFASRFFENLVSSNF
jgi:hypothetical protein